MTGWWVGGWAADCQLVGGWACLHLLYSVATSEAVSEHPCRIQKENCFKRKMIKSILGAELTSEIKAKARLLLRVPGWAPGHPLSWKVPTHSARGGLAFSTTTDVELGRLF